MKNIITQKNKQKYNNLELLVDLILKNSNSLTIDSGRNLSEFEYNKRHHKLSKKSNILNNSSSKKTENESLFEYKSRLNDQIGSICNKAYNFHDNHLSTIENNENNKQILNLRRKQKSYDNLIYSVLPNKPKIYINQVCQTSNIEKKLKPIVSSLKLSNDKINISHEKKRNRLLNMDINKNNNNNMVMNDYNEYKPLVNYNIYYEDKAYKMDLPPIKVNRFLERQVPDKRIEAIEENKKRLDFYKQFKIREKLYKFKY